MLYLLLSVRGRQSQGRSVRTAGLVVIDEAHRLRNVYKPENKTARTCVMHHAAAQGLADGNAAPEFLCWNCSDWSALSTRRSSATSTASIPIRTAKDAVSFDTLKNRIAPICKRTLRRQVEAYVKIHPAHFRCCKSLCPGADETKLYNYVSNFCNGYRCAALPNSQRPTTHYPCPAQAAGVFDVRHCQALETLIADWPDARRESCQ